ncbi:caspase-10 isoform X2 [Dunckerocampus dactyliophorus]|uniref:caspase-10 isoform X2 n=1 Tax=Dunckerocampus dactyliophorus TaxID=161453 RepID=UPI0024074BA0|nr:caspase-10 isoform X2 [Dunckerocampus dactyliophorus]
MSRLHSIIAYVTHARDSLCFRFQLPHPKSLSEKSFAKEKSVLSRRCRKFSGSHEDDGRVVVSEVLKVQVMDFQKLLLQAEKGLKKEDVQALAFLCTDLLPRHAASVEEAKELFTHLELKGYLSAEKPHLLTELLIIIQQRSLIRDLNLQTSLTTNLISPFRKMLYDVSMEINARDLGEMKFLLHGSLPRKNLNEMSTLEIFLEMEKMDKLSANDLKELENIIKDVCPMLKETIEKYKESQVNFCCPVSEEVVRPRDQPCPFEQNQVCSSWESWTTASCELAGAPPLAESSVNSNNTSLDHASGGGDHEDLPHRLRALTTQGTSSEVLLTNETTSLKTNDPQAPLNTNDEGLTTYPMAAQQRGICLIINNYDFTNATKYLKQRDGTNVDESCLEKVFQWLGFEVLIERDCSRDKMLFLMRDLSSIDHSQMDCLVCCILSHGLEGGVYGIDGSTVTLEELTQPFNGSRCRSLAGKPKMFFIQACQGTKEQTPVCLQSDGPAKSSVTHDAAKVKQSIPSDADFLRALASVPLYVSFRHKKHGTWFIQSLCQNLIKMVPRKCDLVTILTKVNADVSQKTDETGVKKQMPQPAFSLTKKIIFPVPQHDPPELQNV